MKKIGRNDPCVCGSGKKFKKCCESKMLGGRFMATKLEPSAASAIQKTAGMASFFQQKLAQTPKRPEAATPLEAPALVEEKLPEKENLC